MVGAGGGAVAGDGAGAGAGSGAAGTRLREGDGAAAASGASAAAAAAETIMRQRRSGGSVGRLRVDIKDLDMSGVEAVRGRDLVITGKHLCGSATDLALRCCLDAPRHTLRAAAPAEIRVWEGEGDRDGDGGGGGGGSTGYTMDKHPQEGVRVRSSFATRGVAIATCCHHKCVWRTYVNKPFMRRLGFDRTNFGLLTRMSSWACDGANAAAEPAAALAAEEGGRGTSSSPAAKRPRADAAAATTSTATATIVRATAPSAAAAAAAGDDAAAATKDAAAEGDDFEMNKSDKVGLYKLNSVYP
jgi:tRNA:m4X modification enzyme